MLTPYFFTKVAVLYLGNSLSILPLLPENSVNMIFADPPYFLSNGTFTCQGGKMVSVKKGNWDLGGTTEENYNFHLTWLKLCKRVLKPGGSIWVSGTYHSIHQCGHALQSLDYHILNEICWYKPNASPNLSCRFFTASHETLIWAKKYKSISHTFNYRAMRDGIWTDDILKKTEKQMRSVWALNTTPQIEKKYGKHPTQKPESLLKRVIISSTNKGDLILDPFTGSSTTGIVALKLKRKFIGIDTEKSYLDLSIKRLSHLK